MERIVIRIFMTRLRRIYLNEYIAITGVKKEDIFAWTVPIAAARLSEGISDRERKN